MHIYCFKVLMFLKEVSYTHQVYIYMLKIQQKQ